MSRRVLDDTLKTESGEDTEEEAEELGESESGYLTIHEVHGFTQSPTIQSCPPYNVAFMAGPLVVIWDWQAEKKIVLRRHETPVTCIQFSQDGKMLASIDSHELVLWDCNRWQFLESFPRPKARPDSPEGPSHREDATAPKKVKESEVYAMQFLDDRGMLITMERCIDVPAIQGLRVWQLSLRPVRISTEFSLVQDRIHSLCVHPDSGDIFTCSNGEIASWSCLEGSRANGNIGAMTSRWRRLVKEEEGKYVAMSLAPSFSWTFVLTGVGTVLVLNETGTSLRTVERENTQFTSCCLSSDDFLLAGTTRGTVLCFHIPSLDVMRKVTYDYSLRDSRIAAQADGGYMQGSGYRSHEQKGLDVSALQAASHDQARGVRVQSLQAGGGFCLRTTADKTVSVIDLSNGNVCNAFFGHLNDVICLATARSVRTEGTCVYSGSVDETIGLWELDGRKSVEFSHQRFIDAVNIVHPSLSYRRCLSTRAVDVQGIIKGHLEKDEEVGGVSYGNGDVLSVGQKRMVIQPEIPSNLVAIHSLSLDSSSRFLACGTSQGLVLVYDLQCQQLRYSVDLGRGKSSGLCFVRGGRYLIARSSQGWVWLLDSYCAFRKVLAIQYFDDVRNSVSYVWPCHDVLIADLAPSEVPPAQLTSFQVITLLDPRVIALYRVDTSKIRGEWMAEQSEAATLTAKLALQFSPCTLALHASSSYVYSLSKEGYIEVNHLRSSESARGAIVALLPREARNGHSAVCMACDPSGLYVATASIDPINAVSTLCIFEAATGKLVDVVRNLPAITRLVFTHDNLSLIASCRSGPMLRFQLEPEIQYDATFVLLGGAAQKEQTEEEIKAQKKDVKKDPKGQPSTAKSKETEGQKAMPGPISGFERYQRLKTTPDVGDRALSGTSTRSVQGLWSDLGIVLDELPEEAKNGKGNSKALKVSNATRADSRRKL